MTAYQVNPYLELIECLTTGLLTVPVLFFFGEDQKVKYNYAFIAVDSFSRCSVFYALKSLTEDNPHGPAVVTFVTRFARG